MLDRVLRALPTPVLVFDGGARSAWVNPSAATLFGLPVPVPAGQELEDHLSRLQLRTASGLPFSMTTLVDRVATTLAAERVEILILSGREPRVFDAEAVPVREDGQSLGVAVVLHEVTGRHAAEQESRRIEERTNRTEEIAHVGSWDYDAESGHLAWSDEVYRIFGLRPQEFDASYAAFLDRVHPDDREAVDSAFTRSLQPGTDTYEFEHRIVRQSDGEVRVVCERCEHVRDAAGRVVRSVGMVHDVTSWRQAEDVLRREAEEFARADRAKDEFLSTLSHEIRTPLSTILVWAHLLVHTRLTPEDQVRAHQVILQSANAQKQIIDDLLDVSRIVSGKMALEYGRVRMDDVLNHAISVARPIAEAKRVRLEVRGQPGLVVMGDAGRLQQVLGNLLTNALKFSDEGGMVSVSLAREDSRVRLRVTDNGCGISPAFLPRVFERFSQEDSSSSRRHGGLGLGLAIVRHLVELHGGTVSAASAGLGHGATFTVSLPAHVSRATRAGAEEAGAQGAPKAPAPHEVQEFASLRILVVDDDADAREVLTTALRHTGADVHTAASADEALGFLSADVYDALIADIGMPGMDGYALIEAVRRLPGTVAGIPALALTAYGRESDRQRALTAGFDQHLTKPVTAARLTEAIGTLQLARAAGEALGRRRSDPQPIG